MPAAHLERSLPATGETTLDLGKVKTGRLGFTCSIGMYHGLIDVS
jgi:plastocyanin domain-containing protein